MPLCMTQDDQNGAVEADHRSHREVSEATRSLEDDPEDDLKRTSTTDEEESDNKHGGDTRKPLNLSLSPDIRPGHRLTAMNVSFLNDNNHIFEEEESDVTFGCSVTP